MEKLVIFCVLFVAIEAARLSQNNRLSQAWGGFKTQYTKQYNTDNEDMVRMQIFAENNDKIALHNQQYELGKVSYKLGMNRYGDMSHDEFVATMCGLKPNLGLVRSNGGGEAAISANLTSRYAALSQLRAVDWRDRGAVTHVKDQGNCGSCWAFSATGALEGQHYRKFGKLVSLSEQNLIDCVDWNYGCHGGRTTLAFEYVIDNNGIAKELSYPYEGRNLPCRYNPQNRGTTAKDYIYLPKGDEDALKIAVADKGPIAVAMDATEKSFHLYQSGVYYHRNCSSTKLNHGVLVIGFGTTLKGEDYWLVKNSWGSDWGMSGYVMMARNKNNHCGIANYAGYPIM